MFKLTYSNLFVRIWYELTNHLSKSLTCSESLLYKKKYLYVYFSLNVFQKKSFFQVRCHSRNLKPLKISSFRVIPKSWQRLSSFLNFLLFFFNYFISSEVAAGGLFWKKLIWQIFKQENTCTGVLRPATLLKIDSNIDAFLRINFHNSCFSGTPPNDCFCKLYKTNHRYLNYKLPINYILHCTTNRNWKTFTSVFFANHCLIP